MGSMFRIGYELIYMLAISAAAMLSVSLWSRRHPEPNLKNVPPDGWLVACAVAPDLRRFVQAGRKGGAEALKQRYADCGDRH